MEAIPPLLKPPVNRWRWWILLILLAGYILTIGFSGLGRKHSHVPALTHTVGGLLYVCSRGLVVFGLIFGLGCWVSRLKRDDLLLRWRGGKFLPVVLGLGYSIALRLAVAVLILLVGIALIFSGLMTPDSFKNFMLTHQPGVETLVDVQALQNNPAYYWLMLTFGSFIVAGLREELWRSAFLAGLRTLWPKYFGSRRGQVGAVFIVAIFFGLGHLPMGIVAVGAAGLLGVGLGLIMVFHRSIWPAIIAHGFFDAASFVMIPWVLGHMK
jgi:membrane protease YdiL (CAAX protease family)